jgi:hypothetical protein
MGCFEGELTNRIADFIAGIGLTVRPCPIDESTFLPGIKLESGAILVDECKLAYPGDLLHEAGHIAVAPPDKRQELAGGIELPESESGGYEMAAIAWSYAALCHLGLDASVVFHPDGYKGASESLIENFSKGHYFGVPVLQWLDMTLDDEQAKKTGRKPYPNMIKWVR